MDKPTDKDCASEVNYLLKEMDYLLKEYFGVDSLEAFTTKMAEVIQAGLSGLKLEAGKSVVEKMTEKEPADKLDKMLTHAELLYQTVIVRALAVEIVTAHYHAFGKHMNVPDAVKHFIDLGISAYLSVNDLTESMSSVDTVILPSSVASAMGLRNPDKKKDSN
jgi:hypothetical protein